jgi:hypothetical protein
VAGEPEWLEGGDAIEAMMATRPSKLPKMRRKKEKVGEIKPSRRMKTNPEPARRRVCVDLDGVLAKYDRWKGIDHFGAPIPGALEFMQKLSKFSEITVFTSRCAQDVLEGSRITPGQLRIKVIEWLEKHGFPYSDVYIGQGKPRAAAFIDDRAVHCSPQLDKNAFEDALEMTRKLVKKPHGNTTV